MKRLMATLIFAEVMIASPAQNSCKTIAPTREDFAKSEHPSIPKSKGEARIDTLAVHGKLSQAGAKLKKLEASFLEPDAVNGAYIKSVKVNSPVCKKEVARGDYQCGATSNGR